MAATKSDRQKKIYREKFDVRELDMPEIDLRENVDEEELEGLAESIKQHEMIHPLIVTTDGRSYELVAGGRRVRAALKSEQFMQPAFIYDKLHDDMKIIIQTVENIHQADFEPMWEAQAYAIMMERDHKSVEEIAREVKKPEARIRNRIKLLGLDREVQGMVQRHELASTTATVIAEIEDRDAQRAMAEKVKDSELSYDVVKRMVNDSEKEAGRKRRLEQERKRKEREEKERERYGSKASTATPPSPPLASPGPQKTKRLNVLPVKQQKVELQKIAERCEKFVEYLDRIELGQFDAERLRELHLMAYRLEQGMRNFSQRVNREKDTC